MYGRVLVRVLTWNLFHGRSVPPSGRGLLDEFAARLAGWAWDVALLQEVPPWWPPLLARACGGGAAHRAHLAQLAAAPAPGDRVRATRPASSPSGGGANAILVRGGGSRSTRRAAWRGGPSAAWCTACAWRGGWVVNLHASTRGAAGSRRRGPTSLRRARTALALGGRRAARPRRRLQPAPSAGARAGHVAGHHVDHIFARSASRRGPAAVCRTGTCRITIPSPSGCARRKVGIVKRSTLRIAVLTHMRRGDDIQRRLRGRAAAASRLRATASQQQHLEQRVELRTSTAGNASSSGGAVADQDAGHRLPPQVRHREAGQKMHLDQHRQRRPHGHRRRKGADLRLGHRSTSAQGAFSGSRRYERPAPSTYACQIHPDQTGTITSFSERAARSPAGSTARARPATPGGQDAELDRGRRRRRRTPARAAGSGRDRARRRRRPWTTTEPARSPGGPSARAVGSEQPHGRGDDAPSVSRSPVRSMRTSGKAVPQPLRVSAERGGPRAARGVSGSS